MESSAETKIDDKDKAEPPKPSLIDKLKSIRWTFKVKNNLTKYVTVEPLICFYMAQMFMLPLIEPYHFHKVLLIVYEMVKVFQHKYFGFVGVC